MLNYLFEANKDLEETYGSYFASSAYSEFRPLNTEQTEAPYEQNRRIEISVVLKGSNIRGIIEEHLRAMDEPADSP